MEGNLKEFNENFPSDDDLIHLQKVNVDVKELFDTDSYDTATEHVDGETTEEEDSDRDCTGMDVLDIAYSPMSTQSDAIIVKRARQNVIRVNKNSLDNTGLSLIDQLSSDQTLTELSKIQRNLVESSQDSEISSPEHKPAESDIRDCQIHNVNRKAQPVHEVILTETDENDEDISPKPNTDTQNATDMLYHLESSLHSKDKVPSIIIKQENNVEDYTPVKRPKRKRSNLINYDESELRDSESLQETTIKNIGLTKLPSKKRKAKETNLRIRVIHSDSHITEMFKSLHKLQKGGRYCDLELSAIDGCVLVHSIVIIAASPFLHKKFKQKLKTNTDEAEIKVLDFQDIPLWVIESIVTFLYTGVIEVLENEASVLSKHCKAIGLSDLHKQLVTKPCFVDVQQTNELLEVNNGNMQKGNSRAEVESMTIIEAEYAESKHRRVKLNTEKDCGNKATRSKQTNRLSDRVEVKEESDVIVKVETSINKYECVDNKSPISEESARVENAYSAHFDIEQCDFVGDEDERNIGDNASDDDTDSYFENDISEKKKKVKKKVYKIDRKKKLKKKEATKQSSKYNGTAIEGSEKLSEPNEQESKHNAPKCTDNVSENTDQKFEINGTGSGGECEKCGKCFYFQYELTGHRNRCTGKNNRQRRKCVTCHVNFDSTKQYMNHRNNDERCITMRKEKLVIRKQKRLEMRRKYCCCACSRKFRRSADQIEHEFLAHEIRYDKEKWPDMYCEGCGYWTMNPWKLHHHKLVSCNKGQEPICDMCGNSYKNEKTLQKHKELMHTDVQPMLTCEECGKSLKGKKGLRHHIRLRHQGENLHNLLMCHICSQTYRTVSDLTFHLYKIHEQPLPEGYTIFQCSACDYCHNNKRFYEKHMFLHQDKREWYCQICSKAFKTKNSLNTHMIVHTSNRIPCPFDDCTYKALKNCHLKNHIENQHTQKGEKHEKCHLCEYSTFFKGNLIKHQRSVHKLEVVTRHSVEMKARYKNLKSGQIVGIERGARIEKKPGRSRSAATDYHSSNTETSSARDCVYPASSSSDNSMVENQQHFQNKSAAMPGSQNVADSLVYTLVNAPIMSHHSNFPANANMYRIPPVDYPGYNQGPSMDHM